MDDHPVVRQQRPFGDTADPDVFYPSAIHKSVCADLFAAVKTLAGLVILTGEPGTGKTTILRRVARDVEDAGGRVLWCSVAENIDAMVAGLARQLGASDATTPEGWRAALLDALAAHTRQGDATVVVLDEAQGLGLAELRGLHLLADAATASGGRLPVLLAGQPGLDAKLGNLDDGRSNVPYVLRRVVSPLPISEVGPYVAYRLRHAGTHQDDVFQADAIDRVAAYADGIPLVINQICDTALRISNQGGAARITASIVDAAARLLDLPVPSRVVIRGARPASQRGMRWDGEPRAHRAKVTVYAWSVGVGAAILVCAAAALFFVLRPTSLPPGLHSSMAPVDVEPPPDPSTGPAGVTVVDEPAEPSEVTAHLAPPMAAPGSRPSSPEAARIGRAAPPAAPDRVRLSPEVERSPAPESPVHARPHGSPASAGTPGVQPSAAALLDSAEAGNLAQVHTLLAAGASPDTRDIRGMTPLMVAVVHDHGAVAELLLARRADVNARDDGGVTALMLAASNGRAALLQRLLSRGASVNTQTRSGWTALTYAAWKGHPAVVQRLLAAGADPALTDRLGWTALAYARWRVAETRQARAPGISDPAEIEAQESREAPQSRYTEVVDLLSGVIRQR